MKKMMFRMKNQMKNRDYVGLEKVGDDSGEDEKTDTA